MKTTVETIGVSRAVLRDVRAVLRLAGRHTWSTPKLIGLGLAASVAETFGITLVILFLYTAMGRPPGDVAGAGSILNNIISSIPSFGGNAVLALVIFLLIVARGLLGYAYSLLGATVSATLSEQARNRIHEQYLAVSYDFMRRHEHGELLDLLATHSWSVASAYNCFTRIVINSCAILVFGVFLFAVSWQITLVAIVGSVLVSFGLRAVTKSVRALGEEAKSINETIAAQILRTLHGLRTVRAYGQEEPHHQAFVDLSGRARRATLRLDRVYALLGPATEVGSFAILCFIVSAQSLLNSSFGTTLAAVALLYRLQPHVREFVSNLLALVHLGPSLRSVLAMMSGEDKTYPPRGTKPLPSNGKGIEFRNVTMIYSSAEKASLFDATFSIPAGKRTALVGPSGAGKSTIVSLLLRLYQPTSGQITFGDIPLDEIDRKAWLGSIAAAGQDIELVEGTILENIAMAKAGASNEELADAIRIAGLEKLLGELPEGSETWIGQQGMNLSGGQRQRIGLARAILRDPALLILDEATNALDRGLEDRIAAAVAHRFEGRTTLVVTHRPETISSCEHVICMGDGRILEEGSFEDLASRAGGALRELIGPASPAQAGTEIFAR